jgi:hypothetical protein
VKDRIAREGFMGSHLFLEVSILSWFWAPIESNNHVQVMEG